MTHAQRMQQELRTTHQPIWEEGRFVTALSERSMTGIELALRINEVREFYAKLGKCIEAMERVLDSGETVDEYRTRIAAEDADPASAAKAAGWFAIEDFAELCDPGPTGFRKRIAGARGQIVRPNDEATFQRLTGTGWREYPERFEYWGDYFRFADNWTDALRQVRLVRDKELA
jgi:hypothetical protein